MATIDEGFIKTGLVLLHYRFTSIERDVAFSKTVLVSHGYNDTLEECFHKIQVKYKPPGKSYHKAKIHLKYMKSQLGLEEFILSDLKNIHQHELTQETKSISS